ncbi:MAG: hypothetical protein MMC33_007112 [Icmadophila ericetorum]|nr:hypothetical protein [Icmadophila ericetorum]
MAPDSSPAYLKESINKALETMGPRGKIDMFECAQRDPKTLLNEILIALAEMVDEGKIGGVALCQVDADTIREAANITKIVAVEMELYLWSTDPLTDGVADTCAELNIPIIAYSLIGRGMLTGQIKSFDDIPDKDIRKQLPRFQSANFATNLKLVNELEKIARKKKCTSAQLALGWLLTLQSRPGMPKIIPPPGATTAEHVQENSKAVLLSDEEMGEVDGILASFPVAGDRYHQQGQKLVDD